MNNEKITSKNFRPTNSEVQPVFAQKYNELYDEVEENETAIATNLASVTTLNNRDVHLPDTNNSYIVKHPLMAVATYDFAVDGTGTGGFARTVTLHGDTALIPDNAIITQVLQDVITAPNSAGDGGTIKFKLATDGDLTLNITADDGTSGLLYGVPKTYALDGNALTAANMGIAIDDTFIKTTGARSIDVEIGTEALTAGKIRLFVWYVVSE